MIAKLQRAPLGLRTIALLEAIKGALAFAAVLGLVSLRHTDLHAATDAFLWRHGIDPEQPRLKLAIETVAHATNQHTGQIAALACAYALIRFAEAYGLWRARSWAEWFAVISAGIYLPIEIQHFIAQPHLLNTSVMVLNVALIAYLARLLNRQRAQRRAKHASQASEPNDSNPQPPAGPPHN